MILRALPWRHRDHHPPSAVRTLVDLLVHRAAVTPDLEVFHHLVDGDDDVQTLTLAQLLAAARAIAVFLGERLAPGARVLLPHPPGLDFAAAMLGCCLAGLVGVPVPPPEPGRHGPAMRRLLAICRDADVAAILTVPAVLAAGDPLRAALPAVPWWTTADIDPALAARWTPPDVTADTVAYLQYTSGSTADPKGVAVDHANLLHNCAALNEVYALTPASVMVYWVPTYHDLGLVYGVVLPLFIGCRAVSLAPAAFLARPIRWLRAIHRHRASHSVAPNFAYELVVARTKPEERAGLDLSCWRHALNGAEPIRAAAEADFLATFAPHGLPHDCLSHSYGMSEATAELTAEPLERRGVFLRLAADALARGRVREATADEPARIVAGCGVPTGDTTLLIVDPETHHTCPEDHVGEVWIRGASVARGYWHNDDATAATFRARLADAPDGPDHLRSGDLGFVRGGQLFITGRRKDLVLVRGENHYPQDLEWAVAAVHPALRPNAVVAMSIDDDRGERLVLATEVYPDRLPDPAPLFAAVRAAIGAHGLQLACIVVCPPGAVPRTASGKVQRAVTRQLFLAGTLPQLARWDLPTAAAPDPEDDLRDLLRAADPEVRADLLHDLLRRLLAARLRVPLADLADVPLAQLGLDSLAAVEIADRLGAQLGAPVDLADLLGERTPAELATHLATRPADPILVTPDPAPRFAPFPLHGIQQAYWVGRAGGSLGGVSCHTYHEFDAHGLDLPRLEHAWRRLVDRHDALRLVISDDGDQRVLEHVPPYTIAISTPLPSELPAQLAATREQMSHQVHPADRWPLFALRATDLGAGRTRVHLSIDLLIADGASLALLMREWSRLYRDPTSELPPLPPIGFRDCVLADRAAQQTTRHRDALAWWSARRPDFDPAPELPLARRPEELTAWSPLIG